MVGEVAGTVCDLVCHPPTSWAASRPQNPVLGAGHVRMMNGISLERACRALCTQFLCEHVAELTMALRCHCGLKNVNFLRERRNARAGARDLVVGWRTCRCGPIPPAPRLT